MPAYIIEHVLWGAQAHMNPVREPVTQLVFRIIRSLHLRVPEKLTVLELKVSELTVSRFTLGFEG